MEDIKCHTDDLSVLQGGCLIVWIVLHDTAAAIDFRHFQASASCLGLVGKVEGGLEATKGLKPLAASEHHPFCMTSGHTLWFAQKDACLKKAGPLLKHIGSGVQSADALSS